MQAVALAAVVAVEGRAEHAVGLRVVVARAVGVVYLEPDARPLVDVCGEVAPHAVLAPLPVAAGVVGEVCDGAQRVGVAEVLQRAAEEAEGLQEEELVGLLTVEVDSAQTWSAQVAQEAVLAREAARVVPLLEVVHHGVVVLGIDHGAEPGLQHPLELPDGNLLLRPGPRRVAPPRRAVAGTVHDGAAILVHDVCLPVVVERGIAPVLVDAVHLRACRQQEAGNE